MSTADDDENFELHSPSKGEPGYREPIFFHMKPKNECQHEWGGWRTFEDGNGGEQVCKKCGLGAMAHTLSLDI